MKKQKQDFSVEYGIYKKTCITMVHKCGYLYEYILVQRGFYSGENARRKARKLNENDESHFYRVMNVKSRMTHFWEDFNGNVRIAIQ